MASGTMVTATWLLIAAYAGIILWLVARGAMRTKSLGDYALGSIAFHPAMVALSLAASMTSAATFIINPGFIGHFGLSGVLAYGLFMPLALYLSLIVLTKAFRRHGQAVKAITLAQWMGRRYGNPGFSLYMAFLALLLITFIVLIAVGMTKVLAGALNADPVIVLAGLVAFTFGYMMFGGANSMVYTNAVQAVIMIVVALMLLGSGYEHFRGGVTGFLAELRAVDPALASWKNPASPLFRDALEIVFFSMMVGIAIVCQPHIITRSMLLREERQVNGFLLVTVAVQTIFFSVVIAGLYARLSFPDLTADGKPLGVDGLIPAYVVAEFPVWAGLIVILGLLSAGLSTLENLIQSLSTTITADIIQPIAGMTDEQRTVWVNRGVIAALALVSFWLSREQLLHPNLSVGIFAQTGVYGYFSAAFVPVLFGIFLREVRPAVPVIASVTALVTHFAVFYGGLIPYTAGPVANPAAAATCALLASLAAGTIAHLLLRPRAVSP